MGIIKAVFGASAPKGGLHQKFRTALHGCVAGALLLGTAQAVAGTVVTDSVFSRSTQGQHDVAVTFGQVFKDGDVPRGATLAAMLNGQPITLQVNPKATNPDGSLRHAVLTAMVPSLPAGAKLPLTLYTGTALTGPTIGLSQLLATGYDAKVSLNIGGTLYTASARSLLQAASLSGACAAWDPQCNVWLAGPLASEWVVNGPVVASNGSNPNLRVYFAVRAYSNGTPGTIGRVRTDIIIENSDAFAPQMQPQYTATLTSGSASYTSPALTQYTATRWHKVLWWNNDEPQVYLQQDTQYIQDSKAVSRYMPLTPDESFLAKLRQECAPLDNCDQTKAMANTGAQDAIGPLPRWTSIYIVDPDVRAYNWMLANTDALGAYSIHYRDAATGWPVSIQKHPFVTITNWSYASGVARQSSAKGAQYKSDLLPNCTNNSVVTSCNVSWYVTGNPKVWDNAHQPAESYVPYMVTGDYYYMSELAFGASHNEIWTNEGYRGQSQGLIDRGHSQVRGKAWVLREMANAAWLLPDHHPLKAEFIADVENSLADWNSKYTNNPNANALGVMDDGAVYGVNGASRNGVAPWQHSFFTWSAGHAAELGFTGAREFHKWLARFEIGLMTDWQTHGANGYCWIQAAAYSIQVKDSTGDWLPSYSAVYRASFPQLDGLACNSTAMLSVLGRQAGDMGGYPSSASGYAANFQIGLAGASDSGLPGAASAWDLFESRSIKPSGSSGYNNNPIFAVIPRSSQASAQLPPTMPQTLDPPPAPTPPPSNPPPTSNPTPTPPVPKELPARQCFGNGCSSAVQTVLDNAAPRPVESTLPAQSVGPAVQPAGNAGTLVNPGKPSTTVPTSTRTAVEAPASTVRVLVRVVCTRFDAWCERILPPSLYVPVPQATQAQAAAAPEAAPARQTAAASVAPSLTPRQAAVKAPLQGLATSVQRR